MSDTRTNAGLDSISVFSKMSSWHVPGERTITILTAGNLASTQTAIGLLDGVVAVETCLLLTRII